MVGLTRRLYRLITIALTVGTLGVAGTAALSGGNLSILGVNIKLPAPAEVFKTGAVTILGTPTPTSPQINLPPNAVVNITGPAILNSVLPRREIFQNIPLPQEINTQPAVLTTNALIAALLTLCIGVIATLLNSIWRVYNTLLWGFFRAIGIGWLMRVVFFGSRIAIRTTLLALPLVTMLLALYGVVFSFLEKGANLLTPSGLQLAAAMGLGVGIVTIGGNIFQRLIARLTLGRVGISLSPGNLLMAVAGTVFSRLTSLSPGIMFSAQAGLPNDVLNRFMNPAQGGNALPALPSTAQTRALTASLFPVLATVGIGALGWLGTGGLAEIGRQTFSAELLQIIAPLAQFAQTLGLAVFAIAVQTVFYRLIPVGWTPGARLFRFSALLWSLFFFPVIFGFTQFILNPRGDFTGAFATANIRTLILVIVGAALFTVSLWFYLRVVFPIFRRAAGGPAIQPQPYQPYTQPPAWSPPPYQPPTYSPPAQYIPPPPTPPNYYPPPAQTVIRPGATVQQPPAPNYQPAYQPPVQPARIPPPTVANPKPNIIVISEKPAPPTPRSASPMAGEEYTQEIQRPQAAESRVPGGSYESLFPDMSADELQALEDEAARMPLGGSTTPPTQTAPAAPPMPTETALPPEKPTSSPETPPRFNWPPRSGVDSEDDA